MKQTTDQQEDLFKLQMKKIYKDYKYFLSYTVNLDVMVLISSMDLAPLDPASERVPKQLQQQLGSTSSIRNSRQSEFYVTAQLYADGYPVHTMPIRYVYKLTICTRQMIDNMYCI